MKICPECGEGNYSASKEILEECVNCGSDISGVEAEVAE